MPQIFRGLLAGLIVSLGCAIPTAAADKLFYKSGALIRSVEISSLSEFAANGTVAPDLAFIFRLTNADASQQANYQALLNRPVDVDSRLLARFLYTPVGERLLTEIGRILQTRGGNNGSLALRAAIVQAAETSPDITLIEVFQGLPTDIQIDLDQANTLRDRISNVVQLTQDAIDAMAELSALEADAEPPTDYSTLKDLTRPGPYGVIHRRIALTDPQRLADGSNQPRSLYVEIYQPQRWPPGKIPVVIFSHGLTAAPNEHSELAEHLASYGYGVVMPQHPGSDRVQFEYFRQGLSNSLFFIDEFINRPLDISFTLDALETRNQKDFEGRLTLDEVAIIGHSFGGYTALAVAGARPDLNYLASACAPPFAIVNISLLLQCQALQLPATSYDFRDPRVRAIAILNPVNSGIFGPQGLAQVEVPVMVGAGSHDPATPAVFEQFRTFPWLGSRDKILLLLEGQAHVDVSNLDAGALQILNLIPHLTLASSELTNTYLKTYTLAFLERYLRHSVEYRLYLRSAYADYLSTGNAFRLYSISGEAAEPLTAPLQEPL